MTNLSKASSDLIANGKILFRRKVLSSFLHLRYSSCSLFRSSNSLKRFLFISGFSSVLLGRRGLHVGATLTNGVVTGVVVGVVLSMVGFTAAFEAEFTAGTNGFASALILEGEILDGEILMGVFASFFVSVFVFSVSNGANGGKAVSGGKEVKGGSSAFLLSPFISVLLSFLTSCLTSNGGKSIGGRSNFNPPSCVVYFILPRFNLLNMNKLKINFVLSSIEYWINKKCHYFILLKMVKENI